MTDAATTPLDGQSGRLPEGSPDGHPFLDGGGELARLIARHDWAATALGAIAGWPQSLQTVVALILRSPVPIVTLWGEGGVMIYNDAYAVFAAARHPQLLGSRVREGWPEVADFNDHVMRVGLAGGTLAYRDHELTLRRHGRPEQVWMNLDYSPLLDELGRPAGVMAIVVETTAMVQAERWKQGEQERLRRMFEQAPGLMATLAGAEHRFELANPGLVRFVGREVVGKPFAEALPDAAAQGYVELLDRVFCSGEAFTANAARYARQETPDAEVIERFVDFVFQPLRDAAGAVVGIFVQGVDATERIAAEQTLRTSEARHRQILDGAIDSAIVATDLAGRVTRWNEGARRMFGWSEAEVLGEEIGRFATPEDAAGGQLEAELRAALASGGSRDERDYVRRGGARFRAAGELTPLRDEAGRAIGFVKVLRDTTRQHHDAQHLAETAAQLRRAQQAGGIGLFALDLHDGVIHGTPEFWRLYGLGPDERQPVASIEQLVFRDDAKRVADAHQRRRGTAALDVEYRIRRADNGEERVIARKAEYERDGHGRPVRLIGVVQDVTERRRVQLALEASESQFRALAQAMPNQVWTAPPDGGLDWFNEQVYAYSGAAPGALDGSDWSRMVHPEDIAPSAARWAAALASGAVYETEFRLRRHDGDYRWHLTRALPIRGADGAITRWVGTNTDIHERKLAEAANARDRDRLWTMSQDLMMVCDFDGRITAVNPSATRLLGWAETELIGHRVKEFIHPDDYGRSVTEAAHLGSGEATFAVENRLRTRDGAWRLIDWAAVADADRVHAIGRDVTEQRATARDQERIWTLSPVLKVVAASDGRLVKVNPAWCQVLGLSAKESIGRSLFDFVPVDEQRAARAAFASGRPIAEHQFTFVGGAGRQCQILWTLVGESGTLYGFGRDVTEQRAAEDALRQSQKMEAVGQLTGGIAHDFNNLLQGITGSLDLVHKRIAQGRLDELDRFIRGAMGSAKRASALTHRLLAFSRRQPLDPRPVHVNPLIASIEDLLRRTLGEHIHLELALAGGLWVTRCDPNQLESAVLNLAINARDAMPDGGRLVIETGNAHLDATYAAPHAGLKRGEYVCVSVTDTGCGMSADTLAKAFEPFFTTKPIGQGTGLGLSMIYGFARQSEGHAGLYSELGKGTTCKLYLPRHRGPADAEEPPRELGDAHAAEVGETVLVIEDEAVVRGLIVEVLADLGYRAIEAADGAHGLEILQSARRIDLLVTDIGLPGLNGRQVAEAARLGRPGLKVLFMTGYAENAAVAAGFLEPGMAMLTKPFAMELLATRIREMLGAGAGG